MAGAFGLLGAAAATQVPSNGDDYDKTVGTMTDECMTAKGYEVVK